MKAELFDQMMAGFAEAIKYRKGMKAKVRVARFPPKLPKFKPSEIRTIRTRLRLNQPLFARYLGTSVACVRSWEQGTRRPQGTALRLLWIAKERPAVLLSGGKLL